MQKLALLTIGALLSITVAHSSSPTPNWAINATAIEACSCPHFCICYFNSHPAAHHDGGKTEHYCKFNTLIKSTEAITETPISRALSSGSREIWVQISRRARRNAALSRSIKTLPQNSATVSATSWAAFFP